MRCSVFPALGLLAVSAVAQAQVAADTARVLEVTLADLDEDSLDFLIGWERWKGDVLDLASKGTARYALVPLVPALPLNSRFSGRIFEASSQRAAGAVPRPARTRSRPPVRTARAPRDGASGRGRRPPRGTAPLGELPRFAPTPPPRPRTGAVSARGPRGIAAAASRGGGRKPAARTPGGSARPRGPRGQGTSRPREPRAANGGVRTPRRHR